MEEPVQVNAYAGRKYPERPLSFLWRGREYLVERVEEEWLTPQGPNFRVRTSKGERFLLLYEGKIDQWYLKEATMRDMVAQRARQVPPSGIRKFFDIIATMKEVISLGVGEPDFVTPDFIRQAGIRSLEEGETHYTSNSGMVELREALSDHLARLYGVTYDPDSELLITVGVSEALHLALLALVNPGEEVIVPEPCFVSYKPGVIFAGATPVVIACSAEEGFRPSAKAIQSALTPRTKGILLGYPNNPTGAVLPHPLLMEIGQIAERHDLLVFSDEIYDRLVYGMEHVCFPSLPGMRDRTVLLGGFSKAYAMTGWRIGYAAGNADFISAMKKVHQYAIMCASTTAQVAAIEALRNGEGAVQEMVREYDRRRRAIVRGLNEIGLPCFEPQGAFYAFPSVAGTGLSSEEFSERLLFQEKVAVVPGNAFGECGEGHVRCSYATSLEGIEEALERMRRFVERCKG